MTDTSPGCAPRALRRRKQARASELRDAALALFVEKGFDATRTDEIAARAGVAKGTLYLYFPSKETLLRAAIASPALDLLAKVRPAAGRGGNSTDALRRVLSDVWAHLQDETVCRVMMLAIAEARRFPDITAGWLRELVRSVCALIADVVRQGMDRGEFRKMDPDVVAHALVLPMFMGCLQRHVLGAGAPVDECLDEGLVPQHIELVLQGLRHDP